MSTERTDSPNPVLPGAGPTIISTPLLSRIAAAMATWPWWAILIIVGLVAMFYAIFTGSLYSRAFATETGNFSLTTNRFANMRYEVRQSDGTTKQTDGILTTQDNQSVTLITQDEQRELIPFSDVGSLICGASGTPVTDAQSIAACPVNSTVKVIRATVDGTLTAETLGQYTIATDYGTQESVDKIGVASETRTPPGCQADPQIACGIKLTLKPDSAGVAIGTQVKTDFGNVFPGTLLDNSQGILTIQLTPPKTVVINKADIVKEQFLQNGQ